MLWIWPLIRVPPILISAPPLFADLNYFVFLIFICWLYPNFHCLHLSCIFPPFSVFTLHTSIRTLRTSISNPCTPHFLSLRIPCFLIYAPLFSFHTPPQLITLHLCLCLSCFGPVFYVYFMHLTHYSCTLLLFFFFHFCPFCY